MYFFLNHNRNIVVFSILKRKRSSESFTIGNKVLCEKLVSYPNFSSFIILVTMCYIPMWFHFHSYHKLELVDHLEYTLVFFEYFEFSHIGSRQVSRCQCRGF